MVNYFSLYSNKRYGVLLRADGLNYSVLGLFFFFTICTYSHCNLSLQSMFWLELWVCGWAFIYDLCTHCLYDGLWYQFFEHVQLSPNDSNKCLPKFKCVYSTLINPSFLINNLFSCTNSPFFILQSSNMKVDLWTWTLYCISLEQKIVWGTDAPMRLVYMETKVISSTFNLI